MKLGKISYVDDLRTIWKHEEKEFTPWLADNIFLLGEVLGLDLEVIAVEHNVGSFSLDILARDTSENRIVAIENQLEISDHTHLGQILTYASGVDAEVIVWICKEVREEHRKAVDWLNQVSNEETEFFAVEIQLLKVDESDPAPFFEVKASPNDWSKEQKIKLTRTEGRSNREKYYHDFFMEFLQHVRKELPGLTNSKKVGYDSWKSFPSGVSGLIYSVAFRSSNRFSCELYLDTGNKDKNKELFDHLFEKKDEIENKLGTLSWERLDDRRACRIAEYTIYSNDEEMIKWGIKKLGEFKECFREYIG